jgi:hypothetical protein
MKIKTEGTLYHKLAQKIIEAEKTKNKFSDLVSTLGDSKIISDDCMDEMAKMDKEIESSDKLIATIGRIFMSAICAKLGSQPLIKGNINIELIMTDESKC